MNYNQFISNQDWIKFDYPSNLISTEEDEGTYLFYTEYTGSFRVTPIKLKGKSNLDADKYLEDLSNENNAEILSNQFNNKYVYYITHSVDEEDDLTIYNWTFAKNNKIVYCSYTINTDSINEPEISNEKKEIFKIIDILSITG